MDRQLRLVVLALLFVFAGAAHARDRVAERLVTQAVDERQLVTLEGNTRTEANAANDRGRIDDATPLEHLHLQLRRSAAGERAAARFVDSLHDPHSPDFHHWLTAAEYGARFGLADADLATLQAWLEGHGFHVNFVYPSRMVIDFSGTAGAVAEAFHTEIHRLDVRGAGHIANMSDPRIPAALAPAVAGVVSLNDFRGVKKHLPAARFTSGFGCGGPCYMVSPRDLQTIYHFGPLFRGGIAGQGETIAVIEDTDLYADADWTDFRSIFGLDKYTRGSLTTLHPAPPSGPNNCADPGVNSDDDEAILDAEWSSAAAPDAAIVVAACADSDTIDGLYVAVQNLVNGASPPPVISISYGICEAENGATANAAFQSLYQQAADEGISVFVATGDNGSSDCSNFQDGVTLGPGVNGWASTAYNVAVGGTDFSDTFSGTNAAYWGPGTGAPWGTARSYVPEMTWNDTCASGQLMAFYGFTHAYGAGGFCNRKAGADFIETGGGEGGPSNCFSGTATIDGVAGGSCAGNPKPSWQADVYGLPADGVRDVPDVSMFAADGVWGHEYMWCFTDPANDGVPCTGKPQIWAQGGGGTSYATPIVAGIQALVDQSVGAPQGNPNYVYYALAAREYGKAGKATCNASKGNAVGSGCAFYDVTAGNDSQDCTGTYDCYLPSGTYGVLSTSDGSYVPAYKARIGFDYPTGIGTINAANLVAKWSKVLQ